MSLLLDTHAFLWWLGEEGRLSEDLRDAVLSAPLVVVSAVSIWEAEIKRARGKLETTVDLAAEVEVSGFAGLAVTFTHAVAAARLPDHHRDPFDRMLVAQARLEGLTLVTRDAALRRYDVPVLWD